jgi:hypothetical protein
MSIKGRLNTYGNVMISTPTDTLTVQDVRDFLKVLEQFEIANTNILLDGFLTYEFQTTDVSPIQCGEHLTNEERYDWLVSMHKDESEI